MGQKNRIIEGGIYFLTLTVVDWVDVFTRPVYKHIIIDALKSFGFSSFGFALRKHLKQGFTIRMPVINKHLGTFNCFLNS